ncbi:MAG TPA: polysaccharide deacetylase family protein [Nitrolancea sp.]|nr:polysaccharide deacetylase family protein [Nitrolancea sp.]
MDVLLTYDNLGEAYDLLRYGHAGGASADGIYSVRRGIPRILEMLARNGLHATFFVEGWGAQQYPDLVREIAAAGHEVGAHGWMHEQWDTLEPDEERELIKRTTDAIGVALGTQPVGWRSPFSRTTKHTLALLADHGYRYDSSFADDDIPYRMHVRAGDERTLIEFPLSGVLNDAPYYSGQLGFRSPDDVHAMHFGELSGLAKSAGFAVLVAHPRFTGRPARIEGHERTIQRLRAGELGEVRFLRGDQAAEEFAKRSDVPTYRAPAEM